MFNVLLKFCTQNLIKLEDESFEQDFLSYPIKEERRFASICFPSIY